MILPVTPSPSGTEAPATEQHFRTDHLLRNLRGRAVSASLITAAAQTGKLLLSIVSAVVLARLLTPADFGLVSMVAVVGTFLRILKDAGLSTATVQQENITHAQVSNLFWINVALSAFMGLFVAALSPAFAWFYRDPRLVSVTLAFSITFGISGAVVQHQALLKRQMRFKAIAFVDITSASLGLLVGIAMAYSGCAYWSLVGMQFATTLIELVLTLSVCAWRPQRPTRGSKTRPLLRFGASLTFASLLSLLARGSDILLIGRFYGADAVGVYSRGLALLLRPVEQMIGPIEAVFTPILSRLQDDPSRYRRTFLQAYGAVALVSFPAAALLMALSRPLVIVLLGPKWEQVVPVFGWFTVAGLVLPLYCLGMCLLTAQGRGRDIVIMGLIFSVTTIGSIIFGLQFGPVGVASALSCAILLIRLPVQNYLVGRRGPVSTADLWAVLLRYLPNCVIVFGVAYLGGRLLPSNSAPVLQLCFCALLGVIASVLLTLAVPSQRREALGVWELLKPSALRLFKS